MQADSGQKQGFANAAKNEGMNRPLTDIPIRIWSSLKIDGCPPGSMTCTNLIPGTELRNRSRKVQLSWAHLGAEHITLLKALTKEEVFAEPSHVELYGSSQ
ncbi:hypothetical protein SAMN05443144_12145 [Fodinibius roseus]|uniref:Uncharacterized protein n=1 Tax=Fodinibius roseus TaxID=1194090 RepID=A0A1M5HWI3_9BACT|nr:hypothetical protein SAMN05443144_12145 [Fodinibius roseus]